jgi:multimeric flavodoxin WrbA
MKILAINGSPRRRGNSSLLLNELIQGAKGAGAVIEEIIAEQLNLDFCQGCLRCNLIKRCAIESDDWPELSEKILNADSLIVASPIYFHHVSAPLKRIIDRFRSFVHVQITETGLKYIPWHQWKKQFVLILSQGSPDKKEACPVLNLFEFITKILGQGNVLTSMIGTRLAISNQISFGIDKLARLYPKLGLPVHLVESDYKRNQQLLKKCFDLGRKLGTE